MDQTPSKLVDQDGNPIKSTGLAAKPAHLDVGAGRLDLLDPELPDAEAIRILETRALFRDKLIELALRRTSATQYVIHRQGGDETRESVYPMGAAADAMFGFLGLSWAVAIPVREPDGTESWRRGDVKFQSETVAVGERHWVWVRSALWSKDQLVALGEGKRLIGSGYVKEELTARLCAFENLKSRMVREVLGLKGKDRAWYKAQGLDLSTARLAEFQDHKSASSSDPNEATVKFGKAKGTKVKDLSDADLAWYTARAEADAKDPEKAKYHPERMLAALRAEAERRAAKPTEDVAQAEELERVIVAVREEAMAVNADPVKLESYISNLKTLEQAKKALEYYREQRKKRAASKSAA